MTLAAMLLDCRGDASSGSVVERNIPEPQRRAGRVSVPMEAVMHETTVPVVEQPSVEDDLEPMFIGRVSEVTQVGGGSDPDRDNIVWGLF
jgi:hypothetical protein